MEGVCSLFGFSAPTGGDCSCQVDPTWTSISIRQIGSSTLRSVGTSSYVIPSSIPSNAKEVLVYAEVLAGYSSPDTLARLKLFTEEGSKRYEQYILVHTYPQNAYSINSDNMWFPLMSNRRLYMYKPRVLGGNVIARVYVIGYR
jgi:hypothetical protein